MSDNENKGLTDQERRKILTDACEKISDVIDEIFKLQPAKEDAIQLVYTVALNTCANTIGCLMEITSQDFHQVGEKFYKDLEKSVNYKRIILENIGLMK